jgi:hypothetical protein
MKRKMAVTITLGSLALLLALVTVQQAQAQDTKTEYANMASLERAPEPIDIFMVPTSFWSDGTRIRSSSIRGRAQYSEQEKDRNGARVIQFRRQSYP